MHHAARHREAMCALPRFREPQPGARVNLESPDRAHRERSPRRGVGLEPLADRKPRRVAESAHGPPPGCRPGARRTMTRRRVPGLATGLRHRQARAPPQRQATGLMRGETCAAPGARLAPASPIGSCPAGARVPRRQDPADRSCSRDIRRSRCGLAVKTAAKQFHPPVQVDAHRPFGQARARCDFGSGHAFDEAENQRLAYASGSDRTASSTDQSLVGVVARCGRIAG